MRKVLATAATAGIIALGFAAGPAQASTTTQSNSPEFYDCEIARILLQDFDAVDAAANGQRDGKLSLYDLKASSQGRNGASPILQRMADALTHEVKWFNRFDAAWIKNGVISGRDLKAYIEADCENARL